jgi:hypothetical protein
MQYFSSDKTIVVYIDYELYGVNAVDFAFAAMYEHAWKVKPNMHHLTPVEEQLKASLIGRFVRQYNDGTTGLVAGSPFGVFANGTLYLFSWVEPFEGIYFDADTILTYE